MWLCQRPANSKGRLVTSIKEFLNAIPRRSHRSAPQRQAPARTLVRLSLKKTPIILHSEYKCIYLDLCRLDLGFF